MAEEKATRSSGRPSESKSSDEAASPADLELHGPIATIAGSTLYPTPPPQPDEDAEEPEVAKVTYEGREILLDPDLQGRITSFIAASGAADHPAHTSPDWSNPIFDTQEAAEEKK